MIFIVVKNLNCYGMIWHKQMIFLMAQNLSFYGMIWHKQIDFYNGTKLEFLWYDMVYTNDFIMAQ